MVTIGEVMTQQPCTLSRFNSLKDARQLMEEKRFRHIPIVDDDNRLIGLVSQRNVLAFSTVDQSVVGKDECLENEVGTLLADIMTTELITVTTKDSVRTAAQLIYEKKIGCLPVVNGENELLGIVTDSDFVAITIHLLELAEHAEPLSEDEHDVVHF